MSYVITLILAFITIYLVDKFIEYIKKGLR
jgi:hypothetical protein